MIKNKGYLIFVQSNKSTDYFKQAVALSMSIKLHNKNANVCLMTNISVPDDLKKYFNSIIGIPGDDYAEESIWKVENRCKIYNASPYDETIVLDADMLVLENLDHWWKFLDNFDLYFASQVKTYKNKIASSDFYRKAFTKNNLPNLYCGMHYFKKTKNNFNFFALVEHIIKNYDIYYKRYTPMNTQRWCSMDLSVAIASQLINNANNITSKVNFLTFTHMKPNIQNWKYKPNAWMSYVNSYFDDDCNLKIGNYKQNGIFHYVDPGFLTNELFDKLENKCKDLI